MKPLLSLARAIDAVTDRFGTLASWAVLLSCFISATNAVIRYAINDSSNGWLEIQWYLFSACVMLGAAQVLRVNEHVRVDIFYSRLGARNQVMVDLFGLLFFLLPVIGVLFYLTGDFFVSKLTGGMSATDTVASLGLGGYVRRLLTSGEVSSNAGGLIRWPAALMLPLGFGLVWLQGVAEIIKRVGWLSGQVNMDTHYERPLQ